MNNSLLLALISSFSTLIGSFIVFLKPKKVGELISYFLTLSMCLMILISVFELMLESIPNIIISFKKIGVLLVVLTFMTGYLTIFVIDKYVDNKSSLYRIGIISFISMFIHNLLEGMIVYMSNSIDSSIGIRIGLSMILHNIPEGIIISLPLYYSGKSRIGVVLMTFLSGFSEFMGALLSFILIGDTLSNSLIMILLLFVAGMMISLSLNEILKEIIKYNNKKYIVFGIISSLVVYILIFLI